MYRFEEDSIGKREIPVDAYYGVQSLRAKENFPITGRKLNPEFIRAMAYVKKACAITNCKVGLMSEEVKDAICTACDEILEGKLHNEFIVDPIQGGAGTSMNMNANEVIANRATEILGGKKGSYKLVHPNDHVNFGQSTNDVIPSSGKIATIELISQLQKELKSLKKALDMKSEEFSQVIKMGRTQMQDAVPITLGQEFHAYSSAVERAILRLEGAKRNVSELNMGGTAIGTGINADAKYFRKIVPEIAHLTGYPFVQCEDMIDGTQNIDCFLAVSGTIKSCAMALSKIANDLRLLSSGPRTGFCEIVLPAKQNGSSIMPGKVNPVIPEVLNQACFKVAGNDVTIAMAVEAGQLELNAFEPVIFDCLFESLSMLKNAVKTFKDNCIKGIVANEDVCLDHLHSSVGIATALCPHIGYKKAAYIAKKSLKERIPVKELVLSEGLMTEAELKHVLDADSMTKPGIAKK
ncbi:MAG: aspartate ammonia-lyase [Clostridia bacterium]|nr:aspartate ammonia-lyase [Clostridia bacterium]